MSGEVSESAALLNIEGADVHMANILATLSDTVWVSNKTFVVIDEEIYSAKEGTEGTEDPWGGPDGEWDWFATSGNGLLVTTEFGDQVVDVRFELWDGPPFSSEPWTKEWEGEIALFSGTICLADWVEHPPARLIFDLGRRETVWGVHAYMWRLREPMTNDRHGTSYDLEFYLVQFWEQR
ncbi:hypothetical protein ACFQVD_41960 [Streptosporangium amethystogenes subsp. fukuiense]|uniref:Uncharacterized protein n=1 Tax=Streptosporangium amethystogenes subsp. fukuiense TaxID=698418 RepID=A0ABW2TEF9_9ACTN